MRGIERRGSGVVRGVLRQRILRQGGLGRRALLGALAASAGLATAATAQVTTSQWSTATSGNWTDVARWSTNPFYPTNGNGNPLYRAEFLATGANYTVTLNSNVSLDSLLLNSANATIAHTSGTLTLGGTATLTAGSFNLGGGTISGGVIDNSASRFNVSSGTTSSLSNVSFLGGFTVGGISTRVRVFGGLSATGNINVTGTSAGLAFMNSQTFSGGSITASGGSSLSLNNVSIEGTSTLTIASGTSLIGRHARVGSQLYTTGSNALVNQGTITANLSGIFTVMASSFTNSGLAQATNGGTLAINSANWTSSGVIRASEGSTVNLGGNWSSAGTLDTNGGTMNLGGTFSTAGLTVGNAAGTVNVTGVADNTGRTLAFNAGTGSWSLAGGTINGGTLSFSDGRQLIATSNENNTVQNVTVQGDWTLGTSSRVRVGGNFTSTDVVRFSGATMDFFSGGTVDAAFEAATGGGTFIISGPTVFGSGSSVTLTSGASATYGTGTLTTNGTMLVSGAGTRYDLNADAMVNNGVIRAEEGALLLVGRRASGYTTTFDNNGVIEVDDATLVLGGALKTSDLGTISRTGGQIIADGTLDNTGSTFDLSANGGDWLVRTFDIQGGTVVLGSGGTLAFESTTSRGRMGFTDVNIVGDLAVGGGAPGNADQYLSLSGDIGVSGTISFNEPYARGLIQGATTLSGGTLAFNGVEGPENGFLADPGSTLTIASDMLIRGGRGGIGGETTINNGTVRADVAGQTLGFGGRFTTFNGVGEIEGGHLSISGNEGLAVNGDITMNGGELTFSVGFGQSMTFGEDFSFTRDGGQVQVSGRINNTGKTFTLDASTGSWNLHAFSSNAEIRGGTLNLRDGAQFRQGNFANIAINGDFDIGFQETVRFFGNVSHDGQITMTDRSTLMIMPDGDASPHTFNGGTIRMVLANSDRSELWLGAGAVTFGPDTMILAGGRYGGNYNASIGRNGGFNSRLINQGTIECEENLELYLRPNVLINEGTLRARSGSFFRIGSDLGNRWENTGEIIADGGTIFIEGATSTANFGDVRSINGGTVVLAGSIDNSGRTLAVSDTTGSYQLSGAVIKGGHISRSGSADFNLNWMYRAGSNIFDGVTFDQDLNVRGTGEANIRNTLTVDGEVNLYNASRLAFLTDTSFAGTINFIGDSEGSVGLYTGEAGRPTTLTLGPDALVRGGNGRIFTNLTSTIVNQGTIIADVMDQKIQIHLQRFLNEGILQTANGGILEFIPPPSLDPARGTLVNSGLLALEGSTFMYGDLVQSASGRTVLTMTADSMDSFALLTINGSAILNGTVALRFADDVTVVQGSAIRMISSVGLEWHADSSLLLPELSEGLAWDLRHVDSGVLKVIPSPAVLGIALTGLVFAARRRVR